jgi:hypothetical protein
MQQNNSLGLKKIHLSTFNHLLFITCVYSQGRISSTIFTKKLKEETSGTKEREKRKKETDAEIQTTSTG